jgi:hypothetical protein
MKNPEYGSSFYAAGKTASQCGAMRRRARRAADFAVRKLAALR